MCVLSFRKATIDDTTLLFNWANDEIVRLNSYNSNEIDFTSHQKWFQAKLEEKNQLFLIGIQHNIEIGLIRFTLTTNHTVVGISIAKEHRGKDLATHMLRESAKEYFKNNNLPIFAYIKKENKASIHSFKKAGYTFLRNETVKECESVIYQLKRL